METEAVQTMKFSEAAELSKEILKAVERMGFTEMTPVQMKTLPLMMEGRDVIAIAPTGTGKTAIAHYIITKNLKEGGRTFYTTPLKALSNEKFRDFSKTYGEENVGIITGDTKINPFFDKIHKTI